jgi:hypothetical protein
LIFNALIFYILILDFEHLIFYIIFINI